MEPHRDKVGALGRPGWSLVKSKSVLGKVHVGAWWIEDWCLHLGLDSYILLYWIYCKEEINKSIYSYFPFCVLNIGDLTGKINN